MNSNLQKLREQMARTVKTTDVGKELWQRIVDSFHKHHLCFADNYDFFALLPSLVSYQQYAHAAEATQNVRHALIKLLAAFRSEAKSGGGIIHDYFAPYERFFSLVEKEVRLLDDINLMRTDSAPPTSSHGWKAFEPNTACPGGPVMDGCLSRTWLDVAIDRGLVQKKDIHFTPMVDDVNLFIKFLFGLGKKISQSDAPNIMIGNYKGTYTFELDAFRVVHQRLLGTGEVAGKIFVEDIRTLDSKNGLIYCEGEPIHLIYNKLDPLMIAKEDPEIKAWIDASRSRHCQFLNSCGAMFLTETKRAFGALRETKILSTLNLGSKVEASLKDFVPKTFPLDQIDSTQWDQFCSSRENWVLKPDALTRGMGIKVGIDSASDWRSTLDGLKRSDYVIQEHISLPQYQSITYDHTKDHFIEKTTFYGLDIFLFADHATGIVGRCHENRIINVGSGGKVCPILVMNQ